LVEGEGEKRNTEAECADSNATGSSAIIRGPA